MWPTCCFSYVKRCPIFPLPHNPFIFYPPLFLFPPSTNLTINQHRLHALHHFPSLLMVFSATLFFSKSLFALAHLTMAQQPNPHNIYKITLALYALSTLFWFHTWSSHQKYTSGPHPPLTLHICPSVVTVNNLCHSTQESPDWMLAIFSILPSPRVLETVVEVSHVKYEMVPLANINSF